MIVLALLLAAAGGFDGRWNLALEGDARGRVWWLEVKGAATAKPEGSFVGAPGGQMDKIPAMEIKGNQLHWYFERGYGPGGPQRAHYQASIENGKLVGSLEVPGLPKVGRKFIGTRAPAIRDTDDGRWKPGTAVELFNGKDTSGWECRVKDRGMDWLVQDGLLQNKQGAADITSTQKFWNFKLHAEFRYKPKSNSGIGLRGRYEVQIYDDFGQPPSMHGNGALYSRLAPSVNASRRPGEWQTFDITLIGRQLTVVLNGKTLIARHEIEGFTAMATDAAEDQPGPITLQGDHGPVEFRKITVTPLTRR